ncbi:cyclopropane-fatty-acyl-phospholipid synthase family protein [Actinocorallia longicatena]|uniref:Cyclopropane-fatty-acyl-phospholipid synthase family protein n=1 Tax=Actinocorallia longicatena TaxID=111803 RepID=A0ABP6QC80_9ACTN
MTVLTDERWPALQRVPRAGYRARAARWLFRRAVADLPVRVSMAGGERLGTGGPELRIVRPEAFFARLGAEGLIGFGEAYMAGDWEADDLPAVLTVFAGRMGGLVPRGLAALRPLVLPRPPMSEDGDPEGARRNISRHYDLSNDLFALFLDETLTYSSALFDGADPVWPELPAAQHRKIDRLLDAVQAGPGTRLLEIGTGWGELAIRAASRGATVRSITLSSEQRELAMRRAARAGLSDRIRIDLCDYREVEGAYDAVVSVEMLEAVGERYWPVYFATVDGLLVQGGRAGIQTITMPHDRLLASRKTHTWVQKYIFPGGLIPSVEAVEGCVAATDLWVADRYGFGRDYARTLRLWRERFTASAESVDALGFDMTFRRMWELYLSYSEAGFRSGYLDVQQWLLIK